MQTCEEGLHYGMKHLAKGLKIANGNLLQAARIHVAGFKGANNRSKYANWYVQQVAIRMRKYEQGLLIAGESTSKRNGRSRRIA